jgi:hypothetical protein
MNAVLKDERHLRDEPGVQEDFHFSFAPPDRHEVTAIQGRLELDSEKPDRLARSHPNRSRQSRSIGANDARLILDLKDPPTAPNARRKGIRTRIAIDPEIESPGLH